MNMACKEFIFLNVKKTKQLLTEKFKLVLLVFETHPRKQTFIWSCITHLIINYLFYEIVLNEYIKQNQALVILISN